MAIVTLVNRSDLKMVDGELVMKRKYGKFKRSVVVVDTNTDVGQAYLKAINSK